MNGGNRPVALVTGASSGIGAELARELARHGHDLILTARRTSRLEALAHELAASGAAATVIAADLARPDAATALVADIAARGLAVDVLIANAGLGAAGRFETIAAARIGEVMQVNIIALTELAHLLLPEMIRRGRGRIMLVASTAAFLPGPYMAVYFASKVYVLSLGEALAEEMRGTGVVVSVLCPGATDTEFFAVAEAGNTLMAHRLRRMMSAAAVARIGMRGLAAGKRVVIAGLLNRILVLGVRYAPHRLTLRVVGRLMAKN